MNDTVIVTNTPRPGETPEQIAARYREAPPSAPQNGHQAELEIAQTKAKTLVDGILRLMDSDTNDPVNIGNPHEVTIEEIARTIIKLVGSSSRIVYRPLPVDDPKQRQPDITRARTLLKWEPKVDLEEGLKKTIGYFKAKLASGT